MENRNLLYAQSREDDESKSAKLQNGDAIELWGTCSLHRTDLHVPDRVQPVRGNLALFHVTGSVCTSYYHVTFQFPTFSCNANCAHWIYTTDVKMLWCLCFSVHAGTRVRTASIISLSHRIPTLGYFEALRQRYSDFNSARNKWSGTSTATLRFRENSM